MHLGPGSDSGEPPIETAARSFEPGHRRRPAHLRYRSLLAATPSRCAAVLPPTGPPPSRSSLFGREPYALRHRREMGRMAESGRTLAARLVLAPDRRGTIGAVSSPQWRVVENWRIAASLASSSSRRSSLRHV